MKKKTVITVLTVMLIACLAVCGTFAYLTFKSETVNNTFVIGDVDVSFTETKGGEDHEFILVPGKDTAKDPTVKVGKGSENCYVFAEVQNICTASDSKKFEDYLTYTKGDDFTVLKVDGTRTVYFYYYTKDESNDKSLSILKDDKVTAKNFDNATRKALDGKELSLKVASGAIQDSADFTGADVKAKAAKAWTALVGAGDTLFAD